MTYKNFQAALTTTLATVYTCPTGKVATVTMAQSTNLGAGNIGIDVVLGDTSAGVEREIVKNVPISAQSSIGVLAGTLVLEDGDTLRARATANASLTLVGSVVEIG